MQYIYIYICIKSFPNKTFVWILIQVPITYIPVPLYKSAMEKTRVVRTWMIIVKWLHAVPSHRRKLPVVLPHDLVPALIAEGIWPSQVGGLGPKDTEEWWDHMCKHGTWASEHPASKHKHHEPLSLYGDDAAFTKTSNEKMTVITLSHCLDTRKNSMLTSWPLCVFRCVSWTHQPGLIVIIFTVSFP